MENDSANEVLSSSRHRLEWSIQIETGLPPLSFQLSPYRKHARVGVNFSRQCGHFSVKITVIVYCFGEWDACKKRASRDFTESLLISFNAQRGTKECEREPHLPLPPHCLPDLTCPCNGCMAATIKIHSSRGWDRDELLNRRRSFRSGSDFRRSIDRNGISKIVQII